MTIIVGDIEQSYVSQVVAINDANSWGLPITDESTWADVIYWLTFIDSVSLAIALAETSSPISTGLISVMSDAQVLNLITIDILTGANIEETLPTITPSTLSATADSTPIFVLT